MCAYSLMTSNVLSKIERKKKTNTESQNAQKENSYHEKNSMILLCAVRLFAEQNN